MKNCFIFSGQGSHRPGMSLNLYKTFQIAKDRIELSNKILGYDISEIMFSSEENVLRQTRYAQPAIFIHSTIILRTCEAEFSNPEPYGRHRATTNHSHWCQKISSCAREG